MRGRKILAVTLLINLMVSSFGINLYSRICNIKGLTDTSIALAKDDHGALPQCCHQTEEDGSQNKSCTAQPAVENCCCNTGDSNIHKRETKPGVVEIKPLCCSESYKYVKNFDSYFIQNINLNYHHLGEYVSTINYKPLIQHGDTIRSTDPHPRNHSGPGLLHIIGIMLS